MVTHSVRLTESGQIASRLRKYHPRLIKIGDRKSASVALILRNLDTTAEMFFIERAENEHDPWSGQIAFPGGNSNLSDQDAATTARRETDEEVGITLPTNSQLARLHDQPGRHNARDISLIISCFVFNLDTPQTVSHNPEVSDSFWVKVDHLLQPSNQTCYQPAYAEKSYPGIRLPSGKILWGLTYRFVEMFLTAIEYDNECPDKIRS